MTGSPGARPALLAASAPPPEDLPVRAAEVRRLAGCGPERRWDAAVQAAIGEARTLFAPRVRVASLQDADLEDLFRGTTPVASIARRGERWGFVATIGAKIAEKSSTEGISG